MTTEPTADPRDRLFALIARIPGSGSVAWCDEARALLDEITAAPVPPPTDQTALREVVAEALRPGSRDRSGQYPEGLMRDVDAVLGVLPEPTDRAAVLLWAADEVDHPESANLLRRLAAEAQPTTKTEHQPRRGDTVEAWLKAQRDQYDRGGESSEFWHEFDDALDLYRLHADTGTPLGEHVCEARMVGQCECLEQPAAGVGQDGAQS